MVASFILNTKAEFLKSKRTAAFWLTIVGAAFVPVVNSLRLLARPDHFIPVFEKIFPYVFIGIAIIDVDFLVG